MTPDLALYRGHVKAGEERVAMLQAKLDKALASLEEDRQRLVELENEPPEGDDE